MIKRFVERFMDRKEELERLLGQGHPDRYVDLVKLVIGVISNHDMEEDDDQYYESLEPCANRIHVIDDGHYQGTLVFVIGATGYQPDDYWFVKVGYGSCGGCDTLQRIQDEGDWGEPPTEEQVKSYMSLALHIIQGLKPMQEGEELCEEVERG